MSAHTESYAPVFVGKRKEEIETLLKRYPTKMAGLLPALWMVQEDRGWVSEQAITEVAAVLELSACVCERRHALDFYT